ncbi:EF-P 5-aminopentanol modification-associated protein YfmF [Peptostreptococcus faecalis]|uniref:EF-P 5-aminopentanol modification-associated protein YfmF n=1 Tax=Peptostreptococcus faecalis TaxID=2045015 RepID=UPI000C7D66C5|nr:pitrilysin family protein [Peptostreptococcus faecalis]
MSNTNIITLDKGVSLGLIENSKFKTNFISIYFERNLKRDEVTVLSLLASLMQSGTTLYPSIQDVSKRLDELYGMGMDIDISKHGEKSITKFVFYSISDKYVDEPIIEDVLDFVCEVIFNPIIVDGNKLNPGMLDIERENLRSEINSKINNKISYANSKCIQNMCKDELFSIDTIGYVEDLDKITAKDVYNMYLEFISSSNVFITIEGDFDKQNVKSICEKKFKFRRGDVVKIDREDYSIKSKDVDYITEDLGINQGKLVIGYRCGIDYMDYPKYYSLLLGNSIFGGGPHSKLFNNVREKESLCYYASSSLDKNKSIMMVNSGIEIDNYERALELIRKELQDLKYGVISDLEIENAKKSMINSFNVSYDSVSGESSFVYNQFISRTNLSLEEVIGYINDVDKAGIVEAMKNVVEDTVYFLR